MADNFNLRTFLTENKLTKNAQLLSEGIEFNGKPVDINSIEIDNIDMNDYPDFVDAYIVAADYEDGTPLTDEELEQFQEENYGLVGELIHDNQLYLQEKAPSAGMTAKEKSALVKKAKHGGDIGKKGAGFEKIEKAAEKKYGSKEAGQKVAAAAMWKNAAKHEQVNENTMMKETNLTAKERRLVEMVQRAMGIQEEEIPNPHPQNPDHEFGTNALTGKPLPDPASQMVVEDEMADETVIPEYNSIDELMKSIDHGTNEVAEKHKMEQMKKIAEALRMKAKRMEESEHAAHISPKDLKQLATDAAKLEKAAEKLKAAFDKKFNKNNKPASAAKAEKVEALQEGAFDLRKFLAENKITANSRLLKEERMQAMDIPRKYTEAIVDARNALNLLHDVVTAGTLMDREMEGTFQFTVTLLDMLEEKIQGRRERF